MRVGVGFDVHSFEHGRPLLIGGVHIEHAAGLAGHSDGDVLCHAIADALLGAARLGDLGEHFPASGQWKDASGPDILRRTRALLDTEELTIVNVDSVVIAQAPPLAPHRSAMTRAIAGALGLEDAGISVKFTTTDGLGFTGRVEGVAAFATALVE